MTAAAARIFLLPDLGEGLTDASVVQWLVAEGDVVAVDQPVVEVETAKSVVEVPSPYAGRVSRLHAAEGETVDVGKPLITVTPEEVGAVEPEPAPGGSGNVLIGYGTSAPTALDRRRRPRDARPAAQVMTATDKRPVKVISPIVRRLAHEAHLDLRAIRPTGTGGVVTRSDVQTAIKGLATAAEPEQRIPLSGFRKAASAVLSRSRAEIPEATVWVDVDATALWDLRAATRTPTDPGPGLLAHLARFVVAGLKAYPVLNSRLDVERAEIIVSDVVNLGIAVQGEPGLVAPAVLGADSMTTVELDAAIRDLTARARVGKATSEELAAGTFTLNNYGSLGVDGSAAIINHPQVAMIGFGRIIDRPWVVDGEIVPRKITQMSFVFDHRVCDGGTAAAFMRQIADAIENPLPAIVRL
ncbi:dihydrolipoamide acetyltransferase family protein [Promicromonospora panici]|uniref:dihydrolipoamide acetyltransferase family protein n=1 Tax=Promicromonospora panici TaxID=2219658 RepID=UPI00101C2EB3|nr:dihydrolipoamide acetyltransferase family protein [Promicromonospora panici]